MTRSSRESNRKKFPLRTVAALAMASGLALTACGGGGEEGTTDGGDGGGGGTADIVMWMYPVVPDENASQEFWTKVQDDFNAANEDVNLKIELAPWDGRDEKIATAIAGNQGPDIVLLTPDQALNYYDTGGLKPVDAAVEANKDAFLPNALDAVTFEDGGLYGVPIYHTSTTAVYNKALFDEAGIDKLPETWDEVKAAAPALAENDIAVMDFSGSPNMTLNLSFYPLLWQAGGTVFTEDGSDVAFDGPEGVEALQFLVDLQEMGGLPKDAATKGNEVEGGGLGNGTTAMGYALVKPEVELMQAGVGEENVVVGMPLKHKEQVSFGMPGVLSLTTINENEEAAAKVLEYISSPEVMTELNSISGTYPARTDADAPADDEITQAFVTALEYARPGEIFPGARQVQEVIKPHLQAALQGSETPEEALKAAAEEARSAIG